MLLHDVSIGCSVAGAAAADYDYDEDAADEEGGSNNRVWIFRPLADWLSVSQSVSESGKQLVDGSLGQRRRRNKLRMKTNRNGQVF